MRGVIGSGEVALRVMRRKARRDGDREMVKKLSEILADQESAAIAGRALEDELGGGGLLRDILSAIWADPEKFKDLVEWLVELLSGLFEVAPVATDSPE